MQLHATRKNQTTVHSLPADGSASIIGRKAGDTAPDIDLNPDPSASRRHARIFAENGIWWIEDLDSRLGTLLNGVEIKGTPRHAIGPADEVRIGKTSLRLIPDPRPDPAPTTRIPKPEPAEPTGGSLERIKLSAKSVGDTIVPQSPAVAANVLQLLQEITVDLASKVRLREVSRKLVVGLRELVHGADQAALLLVEPGAADLVLAAHEPEGDPRVSATLVSQAMSTERALVWIRPKHQDVNDIAMSIDQQQLENVLCAPLIWRGKSIGALWLSGSSEAAFSNADLQLIVAVAHYTAMAVAGQKQHDEFERTDATLKRIMRQFSPRVASRLLEQARLGRLRPGGIQSPVTLLTCDLRGFTRATADMAADDIVDMLNEYFAELVAVLLRHNGTVDKFIGDAILAVFGSPENDPDQHANAVFAAQEMQQSMRRLNTSRSERQLPTLELGIGIHCGTVLHGFIGSEERFEFTVIGDAVNKASRFCDGAGPGEVVISPELHQLVWRKVKARKTEIQTKHEGKMTAFVLADRQVG